MKKSFFKSLILGICFSILFSVGSFANSQNPNEVPNSIINMEFSLVDYLLDLKTESGDGYYDEFCVIIRLGNNFDENSGYYKLDLIKTFGQTLYGRTIKELTCPSYTFISEEGGAVINFSKTNAGGGTLFLESFELSSMGITPNDVSYNPGIGYLVSVEKVHNQVLYFEKLDECPSGGVKLY